MCWKIIIFENCKVQSCHIYESEDPFVDNKQEEPEDERYNNDDNDNNEGK